MFENEANPNTDPAGAPSRHPAENSEDATSLMDLPSKTTMAAYLDEDACIELAALQRTSKSSKSGRVFRRRISAA